MNKTAPVPPGAPMGMPPQPPENSAMPVYNQGHASVMSAGKIVHAAPVHKAAHAAVMSQKHPRGTCNTK